MTHSLPVHDLYISHAILDDEPRQGYGTVAMFRESGTSNDVCVFVSCGHATDDNDAVVSDALIGLGEAGYLSGTPVNLYAASGFLVDSYHAYLMVEQTGGNSRPEYRWHKFLYERIQHVPGEVPPLELFYVSDPESNRMMSTCMSIARAVSEMHLGAPRGFRSEANIRIHLPDRMLDDSAESITRPVQRVFEKLMPEYSYARWNAGPDGPHVERIRGKLDELTERTGSEFADRLISVRETEILLQLLELRNPPVIVPPEDWSQAGLHVRIIDDRMSLYDTVNGNYRAYPSDADILSGFVTRVERDGLDMGAEIARLLVEWETAFRWEEGTDLDS